LNNLDDITHSIQIENSSDYDRKMYEMDRAPLPEQNDQAENDGNANFIAKKSTLYSYDSQNYFHMSTLKSLKPAGINRLELEIKDT